MPIDLREPFTIREKRDPTTFGARVRKLRKAKGYSQRIVSEGLDASLKKQGHRGLDVTYLS
jgi:hypothetical protein